MGSLIKNWASFLFQFLVTLSATFDSNRRGPKIVVTAKKKLRRKKSYGEKKVTVVNCNLKNVKNEKKWLEEFGSRNLQL